MARKRNKGGEGSAVPKPEAEATPAPETAGAGEPLAVDMSVGDLLSLLGRTMPDSPPAPPGPVASLPAGIAAESKVQDLTVGDLLQLLTPYRSGGPR